MIGRIISNKQIATATFSMWIDIGQKLEADPGMFVMVGFTGIHPFLNRPFSIADLNNQGINLIFNVRGNGTRLLAGLHPGAKIVVTGPWGRATPPPRDRTILIAGGIGVAPLLFYLKRFPTIPILYGARDATALISIEGYDLTLFTEDGSRGTKGKVTDGLEDTFDLTIACGPIPMLYEVKRIVKNGEAWGVFEGRMGCGCGICMGCALPGHDRYIRLCTEGPAVPLAEVDFEALHHPV